MKVIIDNPSWARVEGGNLRKMAESCTYTDLRVAFEIRRLGKVVAKMKRSRWTDDGARLTAIAENEAEAQRLKSERVKSLLREEDGAVRIPAGLAHRIAAEQGGVVVDEIQKPALRAIPWARTLSWKPRWYQEQVPELLAKYRHMSVELATGTGKTRVISMVCRDFGLQAVVTSPFGSIVEQTYREFQQDLGKSRVGMYGCGRHDVDKDVVVATSQALMRLEKDDPRYQNFAKRGLMIFDESHMTAADTLHKLCFGMFEKVPYRLFLSGWQGRTDGLQTLLDAITGEVRLRMDVKQGVDQGFLARPIIRILDIESCMSTYKHDDVMKETQKVLYYNPIVIKKVANFANQMVDHGRPTFILVDEIDQYPELAKYLKHPSVFAHACSDVKRLEKLGLKKSNPLEVVDRFNRGEFPILVGTSAVGTGVDVRIPRAGVYFAGGMSEISVRQGMGRMTRLVDGKTDFVWLDIDVVDHPSMHRHAAKREEIYRRIHSDVLHVQF